MDCLPGGTPGGADAGGSGTLECSLDLDFLDGVALPATRAPQTGQRSAYGSLGSFDEFDDSQPCALELAEGTFAGKDAEQPLPTGVTPEGAELVIGEQAIATAAGLGPSPSSVLLAIPYALRVRQRSRLLGQEAQRLDRELSQTESERDAELAALYVAQRERLDAAERFQALTSQVAAAEAQAAARNTDLLALNETYSVELQSHHSRLTQVEEQVGVCQEELAAAETLFAERERTFQRVQAQLKRVRIDLRNRRQLEFQAQDPRASVRLPADHSTRMLELERDSRRLESELQTHRDHLEDARRILAGAQQKRESLAREARKIQAECLGLAERFSKQKRSASSEVSHAERERCRLMADVVRAALRVRAIELEESTVRRLHAQDARTRELALTLETTRRALAAFDRSTVRAAKVQLGLLAGVLAVGLVAVLALVFLGRRETSGPVRAPAIEVTDSASEPSSPIEPLPQEPSDLWSAPR